MGTVTTLMPLWKQAAGARGRSWAIQGTINDSAGAGLDGVTVTLSGDASDSTTTAGGGLYSFPNLDDGSYTVTPTKTGSTFSPTSDPVTVSGANETATTMAQVWTLSGSITDINDAAIQGVLVTLSGDASDTDTTDASGDYSFPNLVDGSYTVTPTKSELEFTPASSAESISGADDTATTMQGFLALPRFVVWTDGSLDESAKQGTYTVQNITADNNSYTPAGYSKEVYCNMDGDATDFITFDFGSGQFYIDALAAPNGYKVEVLVYGEDNQSAAGLVFGAGYDTRANCVSADRMYMRFTDDSDNMQVVLASSDTVHVNNESAVTSKDLTRWTRCRIYASHSAQTIGASEKRLQDDAVASNAGHAYGGAWGTLGISDLRYLMPYHYQDKDIHIAYIWVGDYNDSWPGE